MRSTSFEMTSCPWIIHEVLMLRLSSKRGRWRATCERKEGGGGGGGGGDGVVDTVRQKEIEGKLREKSREEPRKSGREFMRHGQIWKY